MFVLQNTPRSRPPRLPEVDLITLPPVEIGFSMFDMNLSMENDEQNLRGRLEYSTDLFTPATISQMVDHWRNLLQSIVADPKQRLSDLAVLSAVERQQILDQWNITSREICKASIVELFEEQVEKRPEAVAVKDKERKMTYAELNRRANQLARYLHKLGVEPEVRVGIWMERCVEALVGMLGIWKAGGVYVPLDPAYPEERLSYMRENARPAILLTRGDGREAEWGEEKVVRLDGQGLEVERESEANPERKFLRQGLAYVIYTSGSTGKPNGVMVEHGGMVNHLWAKVEELGWGAG
jgi:non-ribosomal peptide synthetase component F